MRTIEAVKVVNHLILSSPWKTAVFSLQIQMRLRWEGGKNSLGATVWNKILGFDQSDAEKSDSFCKKWRAYYTIDSWLFHLLEVKVSGCVKGSTPCLMEVMSICRNPYHKTLVNWTIQCSILSFMTDHLTCSGGPHTLHFSELCCTQSGARIKTQCQSNLSVLSSKWLFPHKDGGSPGVLAALWIAIIQPGQMNSNL